jgi:hypothetical protein
MRMRPLLYAVSLLFAVSAVAQQQITIAPDHGPVAGGTEVMIHGQFGQWPYSVYFGSTAVPATRVNDTTLVATTPAHLPGTVKVGVFEYDVFLTTDLEFRFEGEATAAYERLLLPVFVPPIRGAFGSEFRTQLTAAWSQNEEVEIFGLEPSCRVNECLYPWDLKTVLTPSAPNLSGFEYRGTPGAFLYVPRDQVKDLSINLRAYDTSQSATDFGTQIPIVTSGAFAKNYDTLTIVGVPSDPRFRNTLRIYTAGPGPYEATLRITGSIGGVLRESTILLPEQQDLFHPGYLEIGNLPVDAGTLRIDILVENPPFLPVSAPPDRWAFVSVTNNDTQHITTITPR